MTTTRTPEELVTALKIDTLDDINYLSRQMHRHLLSIQRDVTVALTALTTGGFLEGSGNFGPVGHQAPFDLAKASTQLNDKMQLAYKLGATTEEINKAYQIVAR